MRKIIVLASSLAAILAVSMVVTPSAYALTNLIRDPEGDVTNGNPDFDIRRGGITDSGKLRVVVFGEAGGTKPSAPSESDKVFAYVIVTDVGIVAVTSHRAEDSGQVDNDLAWHSHRVTLDGSGCVSSIEDFGRARLVDDHIHVANTGATSIDALLTAELTINGGVCVTDVFDSAA